MWYLSLVKWRRLPSTRLLRSKTYPVIRNRMSSRPYSLTGVSEAPYCEVDAEPLERYRKGGYHPIHLGDTLKDGRYKILHKLGWGGYATVWLARDLM